jgi:hypothetical protein
MSVRNWCALLISTAIAQAGAGPALADIHPTTSAPSEVVADWQAQDQVGGSRPHREAIAAILAELGARAADLQAAADALKNAPLIDPRWNDLYLRACAQRRAARLEALLAEAPRIIFTKHYDLGGSFYAYTEGQSDAQNERSFVPGASLCLLTLDGLYGRVETLLSDPGGVIRDPDVSYDGRRVLFSWKKSLDADDYHLYELDVAARKVRQLTSGLGFADYEGVYAPDGDILFNSTRCVQTVDCWWTEVSNLYTCDRDGRYLRRLTFDQVHTTHPSITPDGRVLYTRWDYNDRGQVYPQGLFQMFPDGTGQTECYGNNSWFPTSIQHARAIPGTSRIVAIFSGHHTLQKGWLGILDPAKGRQENTGAQLIAPVRKTEAVHVDGYGQEGDQFQYPYPLGETEFLVTFKPAGSTAPFGIYWMDTNGRRELLTCDPKISSNQPVPLTPRPVPHVRPSAVDYRQTEGVYYVQDIYSGPGLAGVPRGTVKKLRVVALEFRAAGIGANCNQGPAGGALVCTPVSIGNGSWDVKTVLGEANVFEDGSAMFAVPARTPVYFQAVDEHGYVVQSMRSWSTLQPGERAACVGCHESKNAAPHAAYGVSAAMKAGVQKLNGFYGPPRGFSFRREIQPILDQHCIRCHNVHPPDPWRSASVPEPQQGPSGRETAEARVPPADGGEAHPRAAEDGHGRSAGGASAASQPHDDSAFSLLADERRDPSSERGWSESYLALTQAAPQNPADRGSVFLGNPGELVNWLNAQSVPPMLPPYFAGAAKSRLMTLLDQGHGGVQLTRAELDKIACWIDLLVPYCGDYREANAWSKEELAKYEHFLAKRRAMEEQERRNIAEWIAAKGQ